jgi:hypothetical protein
MQPLMPPSALKASAILRVPPPKKESRVGWTFRLLLLFAIPKGEVMVMMLE